MLTVRIGSTQQYPAQITRRNEAQITGIEFTHSVVPARRNVRWPDAITHNEW
jgi:hypothetical protein